MSRRYIHTLAAIVVLAAVPANAERIGDWDSDFSHAFETYMLTKGTANHFMLSCDYGMRGYGADLEFKISGKAPQPLSIVRATTSEREFQIPIDERGMGSTDSRAASDTFHALVESLKKTNSLKITYENGASVTLKARGSRKALAGVICTTSFEEQ